MYKIAGLLFKDKLRRYGKIMRKNSLVVLAGAISLLYLVWAVFQMEQSEIAGCMKYVAWLFNIYFILKIINPTQGMVIDYQLIQLKLISCRKFKLLIGAKLYGASIAAAVLAVVFKEKAIVVLLALNSVVNVYIFLKSKVSSRALDLILAMYCCACIYWNSILFSMGAFVFATILFVAQSQMNYEQLLPMYRLMYRVGQRFTGELISNAENEKILEETEKLFGGKKRTSRDWCQSTYDRKNFFFQRKELARIQANKDKMILYIVISLIASVSVLYLPIWYRYIAVLVSMFASYNFMYIMNEMDIRLFEYGYVGKCSFKFALKTKWLVYTLTSGIIMLPTVLAIRTFSGVIPLLSAAVSLAGVVKYFCKVRRGKVTKRNRRGIKCNYI